MATPDLVTTGKGAAGSEAAEELDELADFSWVCSGAPDLPQEQSRVEPASRLMRERFLITRGFYFLRGRNQADSLSLEPLVVSMTKSEGSP